MKLSRTVTGLLAVALLAFMVSDALGQQGRPRGQDGGGRGPGGPGGGPGGFGQRGGGGPGGGDPIFGLLRVDEVKAEIELMPDQDEAIQKITESGSERGERPNFDFRNASEAERNEFFAKMQKERDERSKKMREQLEEVLLPNQMERLDQIALQTQGVRALGDDKVAAKLKITDAQKTELADVQSKIQGEMREKMGELMRSGDRDAMREAFTKMREDSEKQVLAVLTEAQQKEFEAMKGEKFEMPEGAMRGGFGGGRPGGGRPGGDAGGRPGGGRPGGGDGGGRRSRPAAETEE